MFIKNESAPGTRPRRGRPRGTTARSAETRERLYRTSIRLFAEEGYQRTTLRRIAAEAGVSVGLLYRYFPGKHAVVLALYDGLSQEFADRTRELPPGRWRDRALVALRTSLSVLGPHRDSLSALIPILVGGREDGLFASATAFSRERVSAAFVEAIRGAQDAPRSQAEALGRLLYVMHLGVVLWWLLDRSPGQRATTSLIAVLERLLPSLALSLRLPPMRRVVRELDALTADALFPAEPAAAG